MYRKHAHVYQHHRLQSDLNRFILLDSEENGGYPLEAFPIRSEWFGLNRIIGADMGTRVR
jgi:hypothetical protein